MTLTTNKIDWLKKAEIDYIPYFSMLWVHFTNSLNNRYKSKGYWIAVDTDKTVSEKRSWNE